MSHALPSKEKLPAVSHVSHAVSMSGTLLYFFPNTP